MSDPQVRQLAEQAKEWLLNTWLPTQPAHVKAWLTALSASTSVTEIATMLATFASHTRREALREAEEAVLNDLVPGDDGEPNEFGRYDHGNYLLEKAAAAIRLLAEEKK